MSDNFFDSSCFCKISICPPDVSTDFDDLFYNCSGGFNSASASNRFVIEFGMEHPIIKAHVGTSFKYNDIIAYMRGIPVRAKFSGTVTEETDRYIIGEYITSIDDFSDVSEDSLTSRFNEESKSSQFNKVNDLLKEYSFVNQFIKDYILRFRFADIAKNSIQHTAFGSVMSYESTSRICEQYDAAADRIVDDFNDEMKNICQKDNVQSHCEANNLMGIKKSIDNTRNKYFQKILNQYNNVEAFGYNSGHIMDQMIYDEYLNYITSDKFVYDTENPYVVELMYHITTFLGVRSRLEFNGSNIAPLIANFQTLCDDNIRKYWDDKKYDYYGRMREIFQYDFYTDNDNELIQAKINDENRVTLYSKVLKYLETLCNYVPPVSAEEKYKDMDVDTILNNAQIEDTATEKEMAQLHSNLKKISIFFVQLRKIENEIDPEYFKQYISEKAYNDIFTLKDVIGNMSLKEYVTNYNLSQTNATTPAAIAAKATFEEWEKKYTDPFKRITESEAKILRDLADRAINWYYNQGAKIDSGEIFDQFSECDWSGQSLVYKDKLPHDFFFIEQPQTTKEKLAMPMLNGGEDQNPAEDGYEYTEDSVRTRFGIGDYAYWVKYCGVATLVNCMLPMYWPTGLIIAGAPIPLPIIYLPIIVLKGRVTVVIGLGICGICPLPMLLFVNFGDFPGSLIPIINIVVDMLKGVSGMVMNGVNAPVKALIKAAIEQQDKKINELQQKKTDIKTQIQNLRNGVQTDKETLRNLKKKRKENPTSSRTKNGID